MIKWYLSEQEGESKEDKNMKRITSIIFDIDGTLWDATQPTAEAWNLFLRTKTNIKTVITEEMLCREFGKTIQEICQDFFPELSEEERNYIAENNGRSENDYLLNHHPVLYTGVRSTVMELSKRMPVFVVSNGQPGYIEVFLEVSNLGDYVTDFSYPSASRPTKADNINFIVDRYSLESPAYAGDTSGDHESCKICNIPFIYASYGFGKVNDPDYTIDRPSDLLSILM